ncbi:dienelactone hydrolase family protein [Kordia sp.]|uniref:carboxylesterase family protein n=1 Tax=Kordia sp. TaxID=1965332 RepID=UPI003D265617
MDRKLKFCALTFILFLSNHVVGQHEKLYEEKFFVNQSDTLRYRIMMPEKFDSSKKYPIVLFLHGAGERGLDNKKQLVHGSKLFSSKENREQFPAIVIFPQCPTDDYWASANIDRSTRPINFKFPLHKKPTKPLELVMLLIDNMASKSYVNTNQIYVGGLSMGGMGTFEILYRMPKLFAAAFTICGAGNPDATKAYAKNTPLWIFHGANDDVVNPQLSINMVSGIIKYGGKPNFSLYAKDNHNSWDSAFAEPKLLSWLFANIKTKH